MSTLLEYPYLFLRIIWEYVDLVEVSRKRQNQAYKSRKTWNHAYQRTLLVGLEY